MKILISFLAVMVAWPVFAKSAQHDLQAAVFDLPNHLLGGDGVACVSEETKGLEAANIVISDASVIGSDDALEQFVQEKHGRAIAEELLQSYRKNGERSERIGANGPHPIRFLRLDPFIKADLTYDWEKLNLEYPDVKAIVTMSKPAVDRLGTIAVVRYEVTTRNGFAWGAVQQFEKQSDGSWPYQTGLACVTERLRVIAASSKKQALN